MTTDAKYMIDRVIPELIGATIVGAVIDENDEFYGLRLALPGKTDHVAWINCDAEGNGPGWIDVAEIEESANPIGLRYPYFTAPLASEDMARDFIKALCSDGLDFHFDDDPASIINGGTGVRVFTDAEAAFLRQRVKELHELLADPFAELIDAMEAEGCR